MDIQKCFDTRAQSFDISPWVSDQKIAALFEQQIPRDGNVCILDVGGGTGLLTDILQQIFPQHQFINVDISIEMLKLAKARGGVCVVGDASALPISTSKIDIVLMRQVLHYINDLSTVFRECARVLKPGGSIHIGQFVPHDETDQQWMLQVLKLRQPLRKNFLRVEEIEDLLRCSGFQANIVASVLVPESLTSWLGRYETKDVETYQKIWNTFCEAANINTARNVELREQDIVFVNRFALITGTKIVNCNG